MIRAIVVAAVLGVFGCDSSPPIPPISPTQVTEQRDSLTAATKRITGSACDDVGPSGCEGGVCLRTEKDKRVCSRSCSDLRPCSTGFSCIQIYPTDDAWVCSPTRELRADGGTR